MKKPLLFYLFLTGIIFSLSAQSSPDDYAIDIQKGTDIVLDGNLEEKAWQQAQIADGFQQNFPADTVLANLQTEVRLTFDDDFLYVGAVLYQKQEDYIVASLKRDFKQEASDEFAVNIDPFQDKINGFHFAVSPYNVQREAMIDNGSNIAEDWDNKWYSEVKNYADRWVVEMAIPFKSIRYRQIDGSNQWRIGFTRRAIKQNERSTWVPVSLQFDPDNLAFTGALNWLSPPPEPGLNVSVIPYLTTSSERDFEFKLPNEIGFNAGGDAKIAITPSLNLDLTFNPDFSQVEVDRQITNLSRFELFFPERRQFFLENEDLFSKWGFPSSRPFFSRRIGLASGIVRRTTTDGQEIEIPRTVEVPIIAGARLSGKLDKNWRIGLLNMQTARVEEIGLDPANYSVGVIQRRVHDRSVIGAFFVNKENFQKTADGSYEVDADGYNRVTGIEYNLFSKDNKWEAEVFYHRSFTSEKKKDAQAAAVFVGHFTRKWRLFLPSHYVGSNHTAEVGFVPRKGFLSTSPGLTYSMYPKTNKIVRMDLSINNNFTFNNPDQQLVDREQGISYYMEFKGQKAMEVGVGTQYTYLFFPFDPTNSGGEELPENSEYTYNNVYLAYNSDFRKPFYYGASLSTGGYFNGNITQLDAQLNYRWQPVGIIALSVSYNNITLPQPYNSADFWLVGPRAELSFSRNLFFSTFVQYNTQANNVNINSRLQWRFRPVSDVFLVYTDNYFSNGFFADPRVKNRALVLKVTYWLNL